MQTETDALSPLQELMHVLLSSAAAYLRQARPWCNSNDDATCRALDDMAADAERYARQTAAAIDALGGQAEEGMFPDGFTALNDLAADYLLRRVIELQKEDTIRLRRCAESLTPWPALHGMAEEALGNALGHLEVLERLAAG